MRESAASKLSAADSGIVHGCASAVTASAPRLIGQLTLMPIVAVESLAFEAS